MTGFQTIFVFPMVLHFRNISLLLTLFFALSYGYAQKEFHRWYFGNGAGMSFHASSPLALTDARFRALESSTSICDNDGNLLFYTDGDSLFNREHQLVKNGTLRSYKGFEGSRNGVLILPVPGNSRYYYVFTSPSSKTAFRDDFLCYALVDAQGQGEVLMKEKQLLPKPAESIGAALHANGRDYWIASMEFPEGAFHAIRTTDGQFTGSYLTQQLDGFDASTRRLCDSKFSPDSRIYISHVSVERRDGKTHKYLNLYRFDNSNGKLLQPVRVYIGNNLGRNLAEFSSDSRYLYVDFYAGDHLEIAQYDLSKWDNESIAASKVVIDKDAIGTLSAMQLAPDGKIYCFYDDINASLSYGAKQLTVIEQPNIKGLKCDLRKTSFSYAPASNALGGPYYPSFWFRDLRKGIKRDSSICTGNSIRIYCDAPAGVPVTWNTGDTGKFINVSTNGTYVASIAIRGITISDSTTVRVQDQPSPFAEKQVYLCDNNIELRAAANGTYSWSTGDSTSSIVVYEEGTYRLTFSKANCTVTDSISVLTCNQLNYYIPTAFSPTGLNSNRIFRVSGEQISEVKMQIYTREGNLLFDATAANPGWDGTYLNNVCTPGAYYYMVEITGFVNGRKVTAKEKGKVNLLGGQ